MNSIQWKKIRRQRNRIKFNQTTRIAEFHFRQIFVMTMLLISDFPFIVLATGNHSRIIFIIIGETPLFAPINSLTFCVRMRSQFQFV